MEVARRSDTVDDRIQTVVLPQQPHGYLFGPNGRRPYAASRACTAVDRRSDGPWRPARLLGAARPGVPDGGNLPSLAQARLLSAGAFDESQPTGHRAYMEATRYLSVAEDNHEALLALLEHRGATLWAPWSLLRPIFEASF